MTENVLNQRSEKLVVKNIDNSDPYEVCGGKFHFAPDHVIRSTKFPTNSETPHIIGWSGPARAGTTAMLLLLAGHAQIDRVYFQPQKTILRKGEPEFELYAEDKLVCMKEVFGTREGEYYDPIDMLLQAGVPPENITWISFLRDPLRTLASWGSLDPADIDAEVLKEMQAYTIDHFYKYRRAGIKMVPFVYDLLKDDEERAIKALLRAIGLETANFSLDFNTQQVEEKLVKGQAADREYFDLNIKKIYQRKKYAYYSNDYKISPKVTAELEKKCRLSYENFLALAKAELQL